MKHPENQQRGALPGQRIREARKNAGLSQQALAERLGVSRNTVVNWESGRCVTDYRTAMALCEVLGISPADPAEGALDEGEQRLLRLYRALSPAGRLHGESLLSTLLEGELAALEYSAQPAPEDGGRPNAAGRVPAATGTAGPSQLTMEGFSPAAPEGESAVDGNLFRLFAEYPGAASAGTGTEFADTRPEPLILRRNDRNRGADALVRVSGDSMEPVYHDGDILYFRFADIARTGADVVCSTIHGAIVKRMGRSGLFSVNPARPFRMKTEADNVRLLGVVTGPALPEDWPSRSERRILEECFREEERDFRRKFRLEDWD